MESCTWLHPRIAGISPMPKLRQAITS